MPRSISLNVLRERPPNSTVVLRRDGAPFEAGRPDTFHFTCGDCARVVAKAAEPDRLKGLLLVCPACEALNSVDAATASMPAAATPAPPPAWSATLLTGNPEIDEQHGEIFKRVGALHRAMLMADWAETARVMDFLGGYVIDHFSAEEAQMVARGFPHLEPHRAQHSQFIRDYLELKDTLLVRGPTAALTIKTRAWLVEWLRWHILGADLALANFLRKATR